MLDPTDADEMEEVTFEYQAANGSKMHENTDEVFEVEEERDEDDELVAVNVFLPRWYVRDGEREEGTSGMRLRWEAETGNWNLESRREYNDGDTVSWGRVNKKKYCSVREP